MRYIILFCFLFLSFGIVGQNSEFKDIIKLKEGHTVSGKIIEWIHEDYVVILLESGKEVKFPFAAIDKISQRELNHEISAKKSKEYLFKEKGLYHVLAIDGSLNEESGYGINYTIGWKLNRWIGFGLGSGFDSYTFNQEMKVIPVYLEARSYLLKKNISPFVVLRAGYGFALHEDTPNLIDSDGGVYFHPEIGYRFGANPDINFKLGIGIKIQKVSYAYDFDWADYSYTDFIQFERVSLNFGIEF